MKVALKEMVDEVIILYAPEDFCAVGQGYDDFENLSDNETLEFLERWETSRMKIL